MKAVIPAAGLGTRFLPATKEQPKEMLSVLNKPCIQYIVEEAAAASVNETIIINSRSKKTLEAHFAKNVALEDHLNKAGKPAYAKACANAAAHPVSFVYQDEPLGLGHAVLQAKEACAGEPFMVLLGDVIVPDNNILPRMAQISQEHNGASVIAVYPVPQDQVNRFGIVAGQVNPASDNFRISAMVEKPAVEDAPSNLAIFGRYLLSPRVMEILETTKPGAGGEIQLTDALVSLLEEEEVFAYVLGEDAGFDTGTVYTWLETNILLALRNPELAPRLKERFGIK